MGDTPKYAIVTFTPQQSGDDSTPPDATTPSGPIALTLEGAITLQAGLKPNVWGARVGYKEFAKLNNNVTQPGTIDLWCNNKPGGTGKSDVSIQGVSIVGVEAGDIAEVPGKGNPIIVEYRVSFADFREQYVEPRGGRLRVGLVNPAKPLKTGDITSSGESSEHDADTGAVTMHLSDMIKACLQAMNVTDNSLPADVDTFEAPKDVKWFGNHAPTELEKLLPLCNCAFVAHLDGTGHVVRVGTGDDPQYGDDALAELHVPAVDRRGAAVIFSSYPTRITVTADITGPDLGKWEFVVHDTDNTWKSIRVATICDPTGLKLIGIVKAKFAGVASNVRDRLEDEAYRFIRLSASYSPPGISPLLTQALDTNGKPVPIQVTATIATLDPSTGAWSNVSATVGAQYLHEANILQLERPLLQVDAVAIDPYLHAQEVPSGGITVRLSYEQSVQDDNGKWVPKFFEVGYKLPAGGSVTEMSDDDTQNAITGKTRDTFVITRPDFRLRIFNGTKQNETDLKNKAKALAAQYLADSSNPVRLLSARGFKPVAPSGKVTEVRWDQQALRTDAYAGNWWAPDGALADVGVLRKLQEQQEYPNQGKTETSRAALGESGANKPVTPIQPSNPLPDNPPRGVGRYKVLMLLDDLTPGTPGFDFERFS